MALPVCVCVASVSASVLVLVFVSVSVFMCVCVCLYFCLCLCLCLRLRLCARVRIWIYLRLCLCLHVRRYACVCVCVTHDAQALCLIDFVAGKWASSTSITCCFLTCSYVHSAALLDRLRGEMSILKEHLADAETSRVRQSEYYEESRADLEKARGEVIRMRGTGNELRERNGALEVLLVDAKAEPVKLLGQVFLVCVCVCVCACACACACVCACACACACV